MIEQHVFIVGYHRSGTTWLGELLSSLPDTAYWVEPRQVWTFLNWFHTDDRLDRHNASPRVKRHIFRRFEKFAENQSASRFIEKTPSNCLRIPFMAEIFPEGKFIWLQRDGRAILRSTRQINHASPDIDRLWARLRETHPLEYPAYLGRLQWLVAKASPIKMSRWGTRPPEQNDGIPSTELQCIMKDWATTMKILSKDWRCLHRSQRHILHYESLVRDPKTSITELLRFLDIDSLEDIAQPLIQKAAQSCQPRSLNRWREELTSEELSEVDEQWRLGSTAMQHAAQ